MSLLLVIRADCQAKLPCSHAEQNVSVSGLGHISDPNAAQRHALLVAKLRRRNSVTTATQAMQCDGNV